MSLIWKELVDIGSIPCLQDKFAERLRHLRRGLEERKETIEFEPIYGRAHPSRESLAPVSETDTNSTTSKLYYADRSIKI